MYKGKIKKDNLIETMERQAIIWGWLKITTFILVIAFIAFALTQI